MSPTLAFLLTFGVTGAGALAALACDAFGQRRPALAVALGLTGIGSASGIAMAVRGTASGIVGTLQVGGPASMVFGVIALTACAAIGGGWDELLVRQNGGSIAGLIAFAVLAGGAAASAVDLTTVLLAIEISAVCAYALVAAGRTARSAEASMKYFVQGAVATGLFVFGLAVLVGAFAPSGRYDTLARALSSPFPVFPALAGVGLVLSALVFKMGGVPFHSWAPDVYETAPVESAAFLASGQKLGAIAAAAVFVSIVGSGSLGPRILVVVVTLAVLSVLVGSLAALRQTDYRRLLAYAGVAQSGYALIAISLSSASLAVFFGATYAVAATGTFMSAAAFKRLRPEWDGSVAGLAGLGRRAPLLSGSLAVLLISLSGLPPLLGFWSKLLVFGTAVNVAMQNLQAMPKVSWTLVIAVAAGLIGSIVSLGYYSSILRSLFFDGPERAVASHVAIGADDDALTTPNGADLDVAEKPAGGAGSAGIAVVALASVVGVAGITTLVFGSTVLYQLFVAR